jgi:periplasmic divalent cation tolerance protein
VIQRQTLQVDDSTHGARFYMTNKRLVLTTTSSVEDSKKLARALVERRLAACVNIVPWIESVYRWEGKVEEAQECLLLIKTTEEAFPRLRDAIQELHSYDIPECIALAIENGSVPYLSWISRSVE